MKNIKLFGNTDPVYPRLFIWGLVPLAFLAVLTVLSLDKQAALE